VVGDLRDKEKVEFDRVLLNLLSSGRAITDHFTRYFDAQFGNTEHSDKLKKFLAMLREKSWAFAFVEDVRDYIQHQGLPIADYNRSYSSMSVRLELTIDAAKLSSDSLR
jgi:hypothetical protein